MFLLNLVQLEMQATSLFVILVLFAFARDVSCRRHSHYHRFSHDEKIVGGTNDTVENNPYIVYLLLEDAKQVDYQCGGSIISENYILTAAHCVPGIIKATIYAGTTQAMSGGDQYTSAQIIAHPKYNSTTYDNDVAVIRTTKPIKINNKTTKIIKLPSVDCDIPPGTNIKVSGWGATQENGNVSSNLMSVVVQSLSNDECGKELGYGLSACQFCAGVPEGGKDSCQGDSGGPGVVASAGRSKHSRKPCSGQTGKQVGIVSNGVGCARPGKPGVYTKVSCFKVRSWIKFTTGV